MISFGGKEWLKDSVDIFWAYSDSAIYDCDSYPFPVILGTGLGFDMQIPPGWHGLQGIMDQVQKHLLHLVAINRDPGQVFLKHDIKSGRRWYG